ncbi:MAG TPA: hypothetical protein GXX69_04055 [Firmicutes bacterium]|nr:hypothetical protein [Bacillota bacterium]
MAKSKLGCNYTVLRFHVSGTKQRICHIWALAKDTGVLDGGRRSVRRLFFEKIPSKF